MAIRIDSNVARIGRLLRARRRRYDAILRGHQGCSTSLFPRTSRLRQQGFTLIELMVVLVIIGIASGAIGMSFHQDPARKLRDDAERLSQLLVMAQNEVRVDGRVIAWQADSQGYRFARGVWVNAGAVPRVSTAAGLDAFTGDDALRPRPWEAAPVHVEARQPIVINDEWFQDPWRITLTAQGATLTLVRDAAGHIAIR